MSTPSSISSVSAATDSHLNMIVYAHPGTGKTVFWGTGGERMLIMDSDGGIDSARAFGSTARFAPVTDYDSLLEVYEWVKHEAIPKKELDFVVWDSLTLFQDRALIDDVLKDAAAKNPRQDPHVASQREYLVNMNRIGEMVRLFVDLPINFGFSAHVLPVPDPEGEIVYMPMITGKGMAAKISGYMNVVGYLAAKDGKRRLLTQPKEHYYAKDRFNKLKTNGKGYIDDPTLPMIARLIQGTGTKPTRRRRTGTTNTK